jgi:diguanylate cyclase (GGDEF)-like protein/PAS domain S-box-containing protein
VFLAAGLAAWDWDDGDRGLTLSPEARELLNIGEQFGDVRVITDTGRVFVGDDIPLAFDEVFAEPGIGETQFQVDIPGQPTRWLRAVGEAQVDENGVVTHADGIIIDISRERRAQEIHRRFFEQPNGLHLVARLDGCIVETNAAWQTLLGYAPEDLEGRSFLDLVHPDDHESTLAQLTRIASGERTEYFENRYRDADGNYRLISWSSSVPDGSEFAYGAGSDVTQQREAERRLGKAAAVFESSGEGILIADGSGVIREVNDAFTRITGYSRDEAVGQHTRLLRSGRHDADFYAAMWSAIEADGLWRGEIWNRRKSGEIYPELLTITQVSEDEDGGYVAVFTDISAMKDTERQLQYLAHYDQLTSLPNRYLIGERLSQGLKRAKRKNLKLAAIFLDIDSFKHINDSLGHAAGDRLLEEVAERLTGCLRDQDDIGRIGGDEFLIIVEDLQAPQDASAVAEKVLFSLSDPIELEGRSVAVSASLGISLYPDDGENVEDLMRNADAAMYSAKGQGRDTYRFYSERMTHDAFQSVLLDAALREAIKNDELRLAFQMQHRLDNLSVVGTEVLLRWHHPKLGTVPPGQFIPHAERTGLIRSIGEWVLRKACEQAAAWHREGLNFGQVAVNISAPQFRDEDFVDLVKAAVGDSGLPPQLLELEITESVLVSDTEELINKMRELRAFGVHFSIDDFGTGYSSLRYLQRMPIDRLKIDQSFVASIMDSTNDRIITQAVIALADALGIRVIAEGIERPEQARALMELGCREGQGFLYGHPVGVEATDKMLRRSRA